MRALVVEDEAEIAERLRAGLEAAGYAVEIVRDGQDAWLRGRAQDYEAIVLDLGLPMLDGLSVIRRLRAAGVATPILTLSARAGWNDRVEGIDAGADDFMPKPFQMEEVISRLGALARRSARRTSAIVAIGEVRIDTRRMSVVAGERELALSSLEYRALHLLACNAGRVVRLDALRDHVYGGQTAPGSNALEALIGRLRRKLPRDFLSSRRGVGYWIGGANCAP